MCSTVRDLQGYMANLMWFEEEDILEILLLEPVDNLPIVFLTPEEEAVLLGGSKEAQTTVTCLPGYREQALEPKDATKLIETATESQVHECICYHHQYLDHHHRDLSPLHLRKMIHWWGFPILRKPMLPRHQSVLWTWLFLGMSLQATLNMNMRLSS